MQQSLFRFNLPLERLYEHYERLYYHSILLLDSNYRCIFCNSAFLEATGYPYSTVLQLPISDLVETQPGESEWELIRRLGGNKDVSLQIAVRDQSGQLWKTRYHLTKIETIDNKEQYMLHFTDLRLNRDLTLLQQFAGTLMKDINLGVILFNTDFKLIDISDMACRLLGLTRNSVINKPIDEVFAFMSEEHQLVTKNIFDGVVVRNHALSWTNNEERYELLLDSSILRDDCGKVVGGYATFKDVTNLRSLEEQVRRSDRLAMIGQISAGAAHEIRNPLTSIKGFLQMFKSTFVERGMEKEQSYADIMLLEIDRINELVNEFLLLSKRKNVSYERTGISLVLKEILPIIHSEATLHGVTVQCGPVEGMPDIVADRELLKQVFLNISKNGIEAMSEGGVLTIAIRPDYAESKLHVDIHDTGPGIPNFVIDKIFDPFFTTKANGTGLGLSVCQRIIHDMGGAIRVSCKGFGTTFTVSVPIP